MKTTELMCTKVTCCGPRTNLAEAAELLWKHDCGLLPVIDEKKHVVGVVTDRDICIALGTRNRLASEVAVEDVMSRTIFTCSPDDDVKAALATMHTRMVWRLPVVSADRSVHGILSIGAVVRHATPTGEISHAVVMNVLKALSERRASDPAHPPTTPGEARAQATKPTTASVLTR